MITPDTAYLLPPTAFDHTTASRQLLGLPPPHHRRKPQTPELRKRLQSSRLQATPRSCGCGRRHPLHSPLKPGQRNDYTLSADFMEQCQPLLLEDCHSRLHQSTSIGYLHRDLDDVQALPLPQASSDKTDLTLG